ncbi:helix-turn-helix domain-containing protein [Streptomyces sp. NPDC048192]|uniref:helix-turn-helix domain-containing protein n=1 Tax=Streptomyces sp. NPDC048192 TaxID=3365510 RepID=UPI00371C18A6
MARPENPIPETSPVPLRNFADKMRSCRTAKGISYRDMAKLANYSASALSQAASGKELPSWELTRAYIRACDQGEAQWRALWEETRSLLSRPARAPSADAPLVPPPSAVSHPEIRRAESPDTLVAVKPPPAPGSSLLSPRERDLTAALNALRVRAGQPSLRELEVRTDQMTHYLVSRSTMSRVFSGRSVPRLDVVIALARACDASRAELEQLRQLWMERVLADRRQFAPAAVTQSEAPVEENAPTGQPAEVVLEQPSTPARPHMVVPLGFALFALILITLVAMLFA